MSFRWVRGVRIGGGWLNTMDNIGDKLLAVTKAIDEAQKAGYKSEYQKMYEREKRNFPQVKPPEKT